jgi:hypothetical protein
MPQSKVRQKLRPRSRRREKAKQARARETQAAQREAEAKKISPAAYTRRRFLGWGLVALAVVVFVQHLMTHLGFFHVISPGWDDLVVGYPMALLLGVGGAIILSR